MITIKSIRLAQEDHPLAPAGKQDGVWCYLTLDDGLEVRGPFLPLGLGFRGWTTTESGLDGYVDAAIKRQVEKVRCTKCGESKTRWEFTAHPKKLNGLQSQCRSCQTAAVVARNSGKTGRDAAHRISRALEIMRTGK